MKNQTHTNLTIDNAIDGLLIVNNNNPEWGTWRLSKDSDGFWGISTDRNNKVIFEKEFHFWSIVL